MGKSLQLPYANVAKLSKTLGVEVRLKNPSICTISLILLYFRHIGLHS